MIALDRTFGRCVSGAIWRMSILGTLVSARLEHGDRRALLEAAAARSYEAPDGRRVRFTWRTLEGWYHHGSMELWPRSSARVE